MIETSVAATGTDDLEEAFLRLILRSQHLAAS